MVPNRGSWNPNPLVSSGHCLTSRWVSVLAPVHVASTSRNVDITIAMSAHYGNWRRYIAQAQAHPQVDSCPLCRFACMLLLWLCYCATVHCLDLSFDTSFDCLPYPKPSNVTLIAQTPQNMCPISRLCAGYCGRGCCKPERNAGSCIQGME